MRHMWHTRAWHGRCGPFPAHLQPVYQPACPCCAAQVLAFVLYQVVTSLILEPLALTCFNHTLERLRTDPRITVRIGPADDIRAWGTNSESRVQRQQIPHQIYKDANGVEHARVGALRSCARARGRRGSAAMRRGPCSRSMCTLQPGPTQPAPGDACGLIESAALGPSLRAPAHPRAEQAGARPMNAHARFLAGA